jgi:hypothetical protein
LQRRSAASRPPCRFPNVRVRQAAASPVDERCCEYLFKDPMSDNTRNDEFPLTTESSTASTTAPVEARRGEGGACRGESARLAAPARRRAPHVPEHGAGQSLGARRLVLLRNHRQHNRRNRSTHPADLREPGAANWTDRKAKNDALYSYLEGSSPTWVARTNVMTGTVTRIADLHPQTRRACGVSTPFE